MLVHSFVFCYRINIIAVTTISKDMLRIADRNSGNEVELCEGEEADDGLAKTFFSHALGSLVLGLTAALFLKYRKRQATVPMMATIIARLKKS